MIISNLEKTREAKIKQTVEKATYKILAIEKYIETGVASFTLPEKKSFSFSWFCEFQTDKLQSIARNAKCFKDSELRVKIDHVLSLAQKKLKSHSSKKVENEVAMLKADNKLLKMQLKGLADEVERLLVEREELYSKIEIHQAQFKDANKVKRIR
jgi:hypothetical protein